MCTVGNLQISEAPLSEVEDFQHSLVVPIINYNCAKLFLCQMHLKFVYASKYIFS